MDSLLKIFNCIPSRKDESAERTEERPENAEKEKEDGGSSATGSVVGTLVVSPVSSHFWQLAAGRCTNPKEEKLGLARPF